MVPADSNGLLKNINLVSAIPFKIVKFLTIHDNKLSILVDLDRNNSVENPEMMELVCCSEMYDLHDFCDVQQDTFTKDFQYLGCFNDIHYFARTSLDNIE